MKRQQVHIGLRTIKTAAAVLLAMVIAGRFGGTGDKLIFAMLGAMAVIEPTFQASLEACLAQITGVSVGALISLLLIALPISGFTAVGIGIIAIIVLYNCFRRRMSPSLPCFIMVMICMSGNMDPIRYALGRIWDTAIGLSVGMAINMLVFPYDNSRKIRETVAGLDRDLTEQERQEWNDIYASFRSKSVLTGKIIGIEAHAFNVQNRETGQVERRRIYCAAIIAYKVKVLIPETEMWMPGEERPSYVLRNMSGAEIDYVILDVDRVGGMATASRRMGAVIRRHAFDTARGGHEPGERLPCRILTVGPNRCLIECGGRDLTLRYRDISYSSYDDLRKQYRPGEHYDCILKEYDRAAGLMRVSIKEAAPNPFEGAVVRHPLGCRRQAVISGKYGGGVFCTMPDGTTCLCLYTAQHTDREFRKGDTVILAVVKYDYERSLIYGRILSKW